MKLKNGKNSAMMTVELGVSLVLIVVVLFVVIGLFNDNIKTMIGNSNFSRIFSGNGLKTWFQSFNRNYDDSQVYVQIMGEQGLEMLRKKANNSDETIIENALPSGTLGGKDANTVAYLSQVIHIIMSNYEVCNKLNTPTTEKCEPKYGLKYNIALNGNQVIITDKSGTNLFPNAQIIVKGVNAPYVSTDANPQDKLSALQTLTNGYGSDINSADALTRDISAFSTTANSVTGKRIEDELGALLGSLINSLSKAHDDCYPNGSLSAACRWDDLWGGHSVGTQELSDSITLINNLIGQLKTMGKIADGYVTKTTLGYLPSTDLPAPYKPTINADNWYTANAIDTSLIAGSEDALVMKNLQDDPLSLLAPAGEKPIFEGSSDAIINCPSGDTMCQTCEAGGGTGAYSGSTCACSAGKSWNGSACVNGGQGGGSSGTTCPADTLFDDISMTCVTCPLPGQLDVNGKCCITGAVDNSGACCSSGFLDQTGNCGTSQSGTGSVTIPPTAGPSQCSYVIHQTHVIECQNCITSGGTYFDASNVLQGQCRCPVSSTYDGSICSSISTPPTSPICSLSGLGLTTSCPSDTNSLTVTYTNTYTTPSGYTAVSPLTMGTTSTAPAIFAKDYAQSNLSNSPYIFDSRLVKVSEYLNRVKILSVYNDMVNKLITNSELLFFLRQDTYEGSCKNFKSMLRTITNERGLKSTNALITDPICTAGDGPNIR